MRTGLLESLLLFATFIFFSVLIGLCMRTEAGTVKVEASLESTS